jgi:penicillin-binding protein 1A
VEPYLVTRIVDAGGKESFRAQAARACAQCPERIASEFALEPQAPEAPAAAGDTADRVALAPRVIDARNAYLITSLLMDVVKRGTGRRALELGRIDLAGKTGTTNDHRDAWFSGFNQSLVVTTWMGFDDFGTLGDGEFAARTALPMWVRFMATALEGVPEQLPPIPPGLTTARINANTGLLTSAGDAAAIMEVFKVEDIERLGRSTSARGDPYEVF